MLKKKIKWFGVDCGSADHAMNTSIRHMRPDIAKRFEQKVGKSCEEYFGEFHYVHKKSGRHVTENIFPFHSYAFSEGLIHAENIGGDVEKVLNQRFVASLIQPLDYAQALSPLKYRSDATSA